MCWSLMCCPPDEIPSLAGADWLAPLLASKLIGVRMNHCHAQDGALQGLEIHLGDWSAASGSAGTHSGNCKRGPLLQQHPKRCDMELGCRNIATDELLGGSIEAD